MGTRKKPACSETGTKKVTCARPATWRYIKAAVARRKVPRTQDDLRDYPSYSIEEAARYIGVPVRTLRSWVRGYSRPTPQGRKRVPPIIEPAEPRGNLLSFYNLAEAQVIAATRERVIKTRWIRRAVEYMRNELQVPRPLLTHIFLKSGQELFIRELMGRRLRHPLSVSRFGQYGFRQILRKYLQRIERDAEGRPLLIFPLRPGQKDKRKRVVINPRISSGKPALRTSGITAEVIWHRAKAGEKVAELARDYKVKPSDVKAAIRYCEAA